MNSNVVILAGTGIGSMSAEADDNFLFECFEDHASLFEISDTSSSKMFLLGGTGCGKTAILRMLKKQKSNHSTFNVHEMAMNYISNSDALNFLDSIDVKLDFFFQALWRHAICIEYIRMTCHVDGIEKSRNLFTQMSDYFKNNGRQRTAINYLKNWQDKFWITMDEVIRELTDNITKDIDIELKYELDKFKSRAGYARSLSKEKKSQLQQRAKNFVESDLLSDLSKVQNLLAEFKGSSSESFYIVIDQLDENWVDTRIRYRMIRALIESMKSLRSIRNLKIIVAMRTDLLEKVLEQTRDAGFQSEKYEDYFLKMRWTKQQLKSIVNKRINYLYRWKYTKNNVFFEDIFRGKVMKVDAFDYMISRTQNRPRDIIDFVNSCFAEAEGTSEINQTKVLLSEISYSKHRLRAIKEEWIGFYPSIEPTLEFLRNRSRILKFSELLSNESVEYIFELFSKENAYLSDDLMKIIENQSGDDQILNCVSTIFSRLYTIGAVGIKVHKSESYRWIQRDGVEISASSMSIDTRAQIHPMLFASLNISGS